VLKTYYWPDLRSLALRETLVAGEPGRAGTSTLSEMPLSHTIVKVRALSPELLADFLRFFDGTAFSDNPKWSSCYCQCFYEDHSVVKWAERTATRLRFAEANPRTEATSSAENHFGPLRLYLSAGFTVHRTDDDGSVYVRRAL
jgi:hypothetical protein